MIETIALIITAMAAGAAGALAYGYRGQRDQEREQVVYLRRQLETRYSAQAEGSRALTTVRG